MYTYDMYRLNETHTHDLLERLRKRVKALETLPEVDGHTPDLASRKAVFFVAEDSRQLTRRLDALAAFAQAGYEVVLAVPEQLRDPATEAWDYLPEASQKQVRIMPMPPQK